ncbi:mechanosensitive ion channel family protein [Micromonospora sp. HM5-17]|jgi:small conductance mechanosensitive channel|uniref:mechanosensitive ion channel family protein n=1 Tax=Micromonospora sp. HM5-17 TaxID=2487710 RepID=UPI000F483295|nr:mechanosensitive ion channel family protein [Micromonospora sp. HM5-17]
MAARVLGMPAETPDPKPSCVDELVCGQIWRWTKSEWFAEGSTYLVVKPATIVLILLLAFLARYLLHRTINRLVRSTSESKIPTVLKPLRERVPTGAADPESIYPERRRQRAEAIGSVLRSMTSAAIFTIAVLQILSEFSFNLAPLLASAGIAGIALGFGAQTLVKDLISGLFMLLEDQYGVGDVVDLGEATGVVEAVGLRITTVRDARGVVWYIRNGEIIRVGNKSQGWAMVIVDMPIGFARTEEAIAVLQTAATSVATDPDLAPALVEPPEVVGVEQITVDGAVIRTVAKTTAEGQLAVSRELRRRLTEALENSGITAGIAATRMFPRPATPPYEGGTGQGGAT